MGPASQVCGGEGIRKEATECQYHFPTPHTPIQHYPPRLLESVPRPGQERTAISLGFQCVQLLISDFLPTLPKEHIPKTLDVVALFAQQAS